MDNIKKYTCFVSSAGDCKEEREACQKVLDRINNGYAKLLNITFDTFMWENDVLPDMGANGQEIIDEHIEKSNYDIFIGIMKYRFGTPTKKAGSGTEHEFNDAYKRKKDSEDSLPHILFFFGNQEIDPNKLDLSQFQKVKDFKEKCTPKGLYSGFNSLKVFEKNLENFINLFIQKYSSKDDVSKKKIELIDVIKKKTQEDLDNSLNTYNQKTPVWIEPIISKKKEIPSNPTKNYDYKVEIEELIKNPNNYIIKAPSEFGLTTLAHYIKLKAWEKGKQFVYIDSKKTKKHKIVKDLKKINEDYFFDEDLNIDCILLDSACFEENGIMKMIKNICDGYEEIPIIIFNTIGNEYFLKSDEDDKVEIKREFKNYFLLPLPKNEVRKIVASFIKISDNEEDNDVLLQKLTNDLEVLNMHRTVKNCLSILKASSSSSFEYSPINRTKLLETLLGSIFNDYELPTYHSKKPDVKDCSFVLGYLCELLIQKKEFQFSKSFFDAKLGDFCKNNFIEIDLNYLLSALLDNSILGKDLLNNFYFKNSYWVFYFIAQRMYLNEEFKKEVFENKSYIDHPIIMEFYTGTDRNRKDALLVLEKDLNETLNLVRAKTNLPDFLNPYNSIEWTPDVETLKAEEKKISEEVISSGLPDEIKDKYDDKNYNQIIPYNQVINSVIREYSFKVLMQQISASSKSLRNSDFVSDTELKNKLLDKITQGWREINKLLIALSPFLADNGNVSFDGAAFQLDEESFNIDNKINKRNAVLLALPSNVVKFFKDDLYSNKMGPLLINKALKEIDKLIKHELMILITSERPKNWRTTIDNYIVSLDKNSFYLSDILNVLDFNITFKATEIESLNVLKMLSKKCRAKHLYSNDNPDLGLLKRLDKLDNNRSF